jgi:hypothetical protein
VEKLKYVKISKQGSTNMDLPKKSSKQEFLQIWLPLIISILVCIALLVLSITLTSGDLDTSGTLSDIAIVLIILPLFLVFLTVLLVVILLTRMTQTLNRKIPPILAKGQQITDQVAQKVNTSAILTTVPVIKFLSTKAAFFRFLAIASRRRK